MILRVILRGDWPSGPRQAGLVAEIPTTVITLTESPVLTLSPSSVRKTKLINKN